MDRAFRSSIFLLGILLAVSVPANASEKDDARVGWTVVTLASDGAWGVATDSSVGGAIAAAIRDCRAMGTPPTDCGAHFTTSLGGWSLAHLCGDHPIIKTGNTLEEAERAVLSRAIELKTVYAPNMPPCRRVLSVDPRGAISKGYEVIAGKSE